VHGKNGRLLLRDVCRLSKVSHPSPRERFQTDFFTPSGSSSRLKNEPTLDSESKCDVEELETDQDRRRTMLESVGGKELDDMKAAKYDFSNEFRLPGEVGGGSCTKTTELIEAPIGSSTRPGPGKHRRVEDEEGSVTKKLRTSGTSSFSKIQHQQNDWNCLVCTLYVVEFVYGFFFFDFAITEPTSRDTLPVLPAVRRGETLFGWAGLHERQASTMYPHSL